VLAQHPMTEPLHLSFNVACTAEHAWATWAQGTSTWCPVSHTGAGEPGLAIVLELFAGGRIFERTRDGREADWARIVAWEPPRRLVYTWHLRQDEADATEVEIRFEERSAGATTVTIEHRGWERLGDRGPDRRGDRGPDRRDANRRGGAGLLPHFREAIERAPVSAAPATSASGRRRGRSRRAR
jgi:uncharacterized protein YndB with AHSA1/START domain